MSRSFVFGERALAIARHEFPGRQALNGLLMSPLIVPHQKTDENGNTVLITPSWEERTVRAALGKEKYGIFFERRGVSVGALAEEAAPTAQAPVAATAASAAGSGATTASREAGAFIESLLMQIR